MEEVILVITQHKPFLGNQICQIPFFESIRKGEKIVVLTTENSAFVVKNLKYADEIIEYKNKGFIDFYKKIFMIKKKYNVKEVFNLRKYSIEISFIVLLLFKKIYGYYVPKKNILSLFYKKKYIYDYNSYMGKNYLKVAEGKLEKYYVTKTESREMVIIPGGSYEFKKYPLEKYIEIANYYKEKYNINFILGNDMKKEIEKLEEYKNVFKLHIGLKLDDLREIIKTANCIISNDCGPSHFGHIYDIPRIAIFPGGNTDKEWFNSTRNSILIKSDRKDNIDTIETKQIIENIDKILNK
jgi:ADP-heptose:LPS heptosyltransferase